MTASEKVSLSRKTLMAWTKTVSQAIGKLDALTDRDDLEYADMTIAKAAAEELGDVRDEIAQKTLW